jgi:hypothetical protein
MADRLDRLLGDKPSLWGWTLGEVALVVGYHALAIGLVLVWLWLS